MRHKRTALDSEMYRNGVSRFRKSITISSHQIRFLLSASLLGAKHMSWEVLVCDNGWSEWHGASIDLCIKYIVYDILVIISRPFLSNIGDQREGGTLNRGKVDRIQRGGDLGNRVQDERQH